MNDPDTNRDIVEGICDLLEIEIFRIMDSRLDGDVDKVAELLEEIGRPVAAERFRVGWKSLREQFRKSMSTVRAGSKDHAFEITKQAVIVTPACLRCQKGVTDYAQVKAIGYDWMFCPECRSFPDGPELAPIFEAEITRTEGAIAGMSASLAYLKDRLEKCRG